VASATRGTIVKGPRVNNSGHGGGVSTIGVSTIGIVKTTQTTGIIGIVKTTQTTGITAIVRTGIVKISLGGGGRRVRRETTRGTSARQGGRSAVCVPRVVRARGMMGAGGISHAWHHCEGATRGQ